MPKVAMNSGSADRASVRQAATLRASAREYGRGDHETGSTELGDVGDTRPVLIGMPTLAVNGQSQLDSSHTRFPAASQVAHRSRGERVARFPNVSSFALLFEPSVDARRICVPGFSASSMTGVSSTLLNDVTDLLKQIACSPRITADQPNTWYPKCLNARLTASCGRASPSQKSGSLGRNSDSLPASVRHNSVSL